MHLDFPTRIQLLYACYTAELDSMPTTRLLPRQHHHTLTPRYKSIRISPHATYPHKTYNHHSVSPQILSKRDCREPRQPTTI